MNDKTEKEPTYWLQFARGGFCIDEQHNREDVADCVRVWTEGGCILSVCKNGSGWRYEGSDFGMFPEHPNVDEMRWPTWRAAIDEFGFQEVTE